MRTVLVLRWSVLPLLHVAGQTTEWLLGQVLVYEWDEESWNWRNVIIAGYEGSWNWRNVVIAGYEGSWNWRNVIITGYEGSWNWRNVIITGYDGLWNCQTYKSRQSLDVVLVSFMESAVAWVAHSFVLVLLLAWKHSFTMMMSIATCTEIRIHPELPAP